ISHFTKHIHCEEPKPQLLISIEALIEWLPCIGELFQSGRPLSQDISAFAQKLDRVALTWSADPRCQVRQALMPCRHPGADRLLYCRPVFCLVRREAECELKHLDAP